MSISRPDASAAAPARGATQQPPVIAITPGEPAGVGPDIVLHNALAGSPTITVAIADPDLLRARAAQLQLPVTIDLIGDRTPDAPAPPGRLWVLPVALANPCIAGQIDPANAPYVLECLDQAIAGCLGRNHQLRCNAMVTGPVNKAAINSAGIPFSGHTEYLAKQTNTDQVVMMLATDTLRVALATTHLPLREVSDAITQPGLQRTIEIIHHDLVHHFGIVSPRILILGLNPHAGEGGHLGREDIDIIEPVISACRQRGYQLSGPLPADTAFTPPYLAHADAVLAMYHDQGLPVLKAQGFGRAVNITLGLPIVRTSVDHGTALDLAGSGRASYGSLQAAIALAGQMGASRNHVTAETSPLPHSTTRA